MSEVDDLDEAGHTPETIQRIERAMEKYAPTGYDPASDDLTIPFAMELVEKDRRIESDAKVIAALREALMEIERLGWKEGLGAEHGIAAHYAIKKVVRKALATYEQTIGKSK